MLAHPLDDTRVSLDDYAAEWKWDGIRIQLVHAGGQTRLYSRTGDDISGSFPDVASAFADPSGARWRVAGSGRSPGRRGMAARRPASTRLQQRLGRKNVSAKMQGQYPAFVRLYDILFDGERTCGRWPGSSAGRGWRRSCRGSTLTGSTCRELIEAGSFEALEEMRLGVRSEGVEGMMLKRRDSPYVAGRRTGLWYKWKRDPLTADCVLMYAQRGSGKRSSYYSDYTFGCWTAEGELLPVGKAYFGFTDEELKWLDRFVRNHTVNRFGPVREVEKSLVLEVAFDSIHRSTRHKSGLAMRFPRISRIRTDKPAHEADRIETLLAMATYEEKPARIAPDGLSLPAQGKLLSCSGCRFTAAYLPRRSTSMSNSNRSPSLIVGRPARSTAEMWTNASGWPSSRLIKPKPFIELKNLTVPWAFSPVS